MNYIKRLEKENRELAAEVAGIREGHRELLRYICSEKFENDTTVQVQDVINRLRDVESFVDKELAEQVCQHCGNGYLSHRAPVGFCSEYCSELHKLDCRY